MGCEENALHKMAPKSWGDCLHSVVKKDRNQCVCVKETIISQRLHFQFQ